MFFNTPAEEESVGFQKVPPGTYLAVVCDSEIKTTKKGDGRYVAIALEVQPLGAKIFHNFNIENPSEVAVRIGRGELKSFLKACEVDQPLQTENDLHRLISNKLLRIQTSLETGKDGVERARIQKFIPKSVPGGVAAPTGQLAADDMPF